MATTGSYSTSTGVDLNLVAYYSYEQSTANNTSTVTVTLKLKHKSLRATSLSGSYLSVAGNQVNYTKTISQTSNTLTETTLATQTVTIQHNDTTGQGTCRIKGTFVLNGSYSGVTINTLTIDQTLTLTTIPRASGLSVPASVNTGSDLTVTITPANSTFKHKVEFKIGATIVYSSDFIPAGTNTRSYSISHSWFPSSTSGSIVVYLHTYRSDSTFVATVYKTVTANVPANIVPSISDFVATIYSGGLSDLYVQGKSVARLTTTAIAGNGSSISSYTYSGPDIVATGTSSNSTSATWITSTIRSSGTLTYTVEVQDARGRKVSKTVQIYVWPYSPPAFGAVTVQRSTSTGDASQSGTYASYTINSTYSSVNGKNTRTITAAYSSNNGSTYSTDTTINSDTGSSNSITGVYGGGALAISNTYLIKFTITDSYGAKASIEVPLKSAERAFNIAKYGNGAAVGGFSSVTDATASPKFECHWPTYIEGRRALTVGEVEGTARLLTNVFVKNFRSQPTGYMCIRLGTATMSLYNMITVKGHITSYQNSTSFEASCYFYYDNGTFHMPVATMSNPNIVQEAYFAQGISDGCVYLILGAIDSLWAYPTVAIDSVSVGFANPDSDAWTSGWKAEVYADLASNFTKLTSCTRGGMNKTLWSGTAGIGTTLTLSENFRNFKFLTCIIGTTTDPYGIVLGSFLDSTIAELHFGAIFTNSGGLAGSNFYGAKFATSGGTSVTLAGCGTAAASNLSVRKIVGWR